MARRPDSKDIEALRKFTLLWTEKSQNHRLSNDLIQKISNIESFVHGFLANCTHGLVIVSVKDGDDYLQIRELISDEVGRRLHILSVRIPQSSLTICQIREIESLQWIILNVLTSQYGLPPDSFTPGSQTLTSIYRSSLLSFIVGSRRVE